MRQLAAREASVWDAPALLDWDSSGDAQDYRDTVETRARALDADRPAKGMCSARATTNNRKYPADCRTSKYD